MDPIQQLISTLRANDWGIQFSGSWFEDESMMDTWAIIARDGSAVDSANLSVPEKIIEKFACYLYMRFDVAGHGISEKWFPGIAVPSSSLRDDKPIEAVTWDVVTYWCGVM